MRIQPLSLGEYPWVVRFFFWLQRKKYGAVLTSSLLWARSPRVFIGLSCFFGALNRKNSPLPTALRTLVIVKVSQLNVCAFCMDLNSSLFLKISENKEKLKELENWRDSELFDEKEKAVFEYAETITRSDQQVNDELMEKLKRYFTEEALIELTALIAYQNMTTKFNTALGVPSQGFCSFKTGAP